MRRNLTRLCARIAVHQRFVCLFPCTNKGDLEKQSKLIFKIISWIIQIFDREDRDKELEALAERHIKYQVCVCVRGARAIITLISSTGPRGQL